MFFEAENVTKRFGGITAVSNMSFSIERSEIVGVFGPNGSGKTTLLSLIAGVIRPSIGRLMWKSQPINGKPPHEVAAAGIVKTFQNPQLFAELSVVEHVLIAAHLRLQRQLGFRRIKTLMRADGGGAELAERVEHVLHLCRLTELRDEPAASLS